MFRTPLAVLLIATLMTSACDETVEDHYRDRRGFASSGAPQTLVNLVPDGASDIRLCTDADSGRLWGTYVLNNQGDIEKLTLSPIAASSLVGVYTGAPGRLEWWPSWWRRSVSLDALSSSGLSFFEAKAGDPGSISVLAFDQTRSRVYLWIRRRD